MESAKHDLEGKGLPPEMAWAHFFFITYQKVERVDPLSIFYLDG